MSAHSASAIDRLSEAALRDLYARHAYPVSDRVTVEELREALRQEVEHGVIDAEVILDELLAAEVAPAPEWRLAA